MWDESCFFKSFILGLRKSEAALSANYVALIQMKGVGDSFVCPIFYVAQQTQLNLTFWMQDFQKNERTVHQFSATQHDHAYFVSFMLYLFLLFPPLPAPILFVQIPRALRQRNEQSFDFGSVEAYASLREHFIWKTLNTLWTVNCLILCQYLSRLPARLPAAVREGAAEIGPNTSVPHYWSFISDFNNGFYQ